jgi:hypothetical protein
MPDISEQEVWLRAYCSCLLRASTTAVAIEMANQAVKDFFERFPKFQFASSKPE